MKSVAYSLGWAAYGWNCGSGVTPLENPYTIGSEDHAEWQRGHDEAQAKDEETGHL